MARKPRIEFPGALYHVFSRGNNKQQVFKSDRDYITFLERLKKYSERYQFKVYVYVLMPNHFHIVIETHIAPLSKIMQGLLQSYTLYFHKTYGSVGHLFQGRYKAILCDKETYLMELVRYIPLNPVRSDIVNLPEDYKWSSYQTYFGDSSKSFIDTEFVFNLFNKDRTIAKKMLWLFIRDGLSTGHKEELYDVVDQRILGSENFVEEVMTKKDTKLVMDYEEENTKPLNTPQALTEILDVVSDVTEIPKTAILGSSKKPQISGARGIFAYVAVKYAGFNTRKISNLINKDPSSVTYMVRRIETRKRESSDLYYLLEKVFQLIKV
ncbi:transposase [Acidobacteriota bacterium]